MEFTVHEVSPETNLVVLRGRLDAEGAAKAELPFTAAVGSVGRNAALDFTGVTFCGSLGIRMLLAVARVVQRKERRIVLFGVSPMVAEVFETVALNDLIPIVGTQAEAMAKIAG